MLVLTRYRDEKIILTLEDGRRIVLQVIETRGDKCRIGIECDKTIMINRNEVQERIDEHLARTS